MAYEEKNSTYAAKYPETPYPVPVRPEPVSPGVLERLAEASAAYAQASAKFIDSRANLNDARQRWQDIRDEFAKAAEQEGI